jgi:predicted nucleic acid-binding protein
MKITFDTSVLVAAAVGCHPRHKEAAALLELARSKAHDGFLSTHALAELYSVLTKIPLE